MEKQVEERTPFSVKETIVTTQLREEAPNVEYEQESTTSFQITSKSPQTLNTGNLYSVAQEALDLSQQEEPSIDAGQDTRETLRSNSAVSAETKARWELLRALAGVQGTRPRSVEPQESSSDTDVYRPSIKLRRSLARRGRRPLSASSFPGMRPLLLPQKVLNDRAASPTRSEDHLLPYSLETREATLSDVNEHSKEGIVQTSSEHGQGLKATEGAITPKRSIKIHSSQLEIEVDKSFLSPTLPSMKSTATQNTTPPSQVQSGPRQSPSSSYAAQQQPPIPYQAVQYQLPSNQSSPAGTLSSRPSSHGLEAQTSFQPLSTSDVRRNTIPQSQTQPPRRPMIPPQNLSSNDRAFTPPLRPSINSQTSQSLDPQQPVLQINSRRLTSQSTRPVSVPSNSSQSILLIPGEQSSRLPPRSQPPQHPVSAPQTPPALQPSFAPNTQQRPMSPNQQSVIPTQQRPPLPIQQQSVPNPLQGRNSNSPQQLPLAGSRPLDSPTAQRLPSNPPQNRMSLSQTPSPNQPAQQCLANQYSQQMPLPSQSISPPQNRPPPRSLPPSQGPLQDLPLPQTQPPPQRFIASQQNPRVSSPNPPMIPPRTNPPHPSLELRQQKSAPQQHPHQPRSPQQAGFFKLHPAPPQNPSSAQRATPPQTSNPQNPVPQHPLTQHTPFQPGISQHSNPVTSEDLFQSLTQHPSRRRNQPSTSASDPTNLATPAFSNPCNAGDVPQYRPSTLSSNLPPQRPQMTSQVSPQVAVQHTPPTQPHPNAIPRPGQTQPNSLGITRKPLSQSVTDRPQSSLPNAPIEASGQSQLSAQNPTNTPRIRGESQSGPSLSYTPPQLRQQTGNPQTPTPGITSPQDPSRPKIPVMLQSQPSPASRASNDRVNQKTTSSVDSVQGDQSERGHSGSDLNQERKQKQKPSVEELLALWLQGELPDDFLSTESGKRMIPEMLFYGMIFVGKMFFEEFKEDPRRRR